MELNIAEIPYEDGVVQYRYARYLSEDGLRWIRHGLFCAYHPNGNLASEGAYVDGQEHGSWTDYHANGQTAAKGNYDKGVEVGHWDYWNEDGSSNSQAA
jgi:antitoxin component YwqK of YwqJK toxin-antitoxin module